MTREEAIETLNEIKSLLTILYTTFDEKKKRERRKEALDMAIKSLESLEQDRPIGHWEIYQSPNRNVIACSCCLQPIYDPHMNYYYCPFCGAKME